VNIDQNPHKNHQWFAQPHKAGCLGLFNPVNKQFFADQSRLSQGMGLGLYICRKPINGMGGFY
jgi:hypothetical protein